MFFFILRIDKNVIYEDKNKLVQILAETLFVRHMNVDGTFVRPNGTTAKS